MSEEELYVLLAVGCLVLVGLIGAMVICAAIAFIVKQEPKE